MTRKICMALTGAVLSLALVGTVSATTFTEGTDAGDSIATSTLLPGGVDSISGWLENDADLFGFYWGGGAFYVNSAGSEHDTQLFLFDNAGVGIQGNDDGIAFAGPAYLQIANLLQGLYYLGVSQFDFDPFTSSGALIFETYPYEPLYGPLTTDPLDHWEGTNYALGAYLVSFQQITADGDPIGDPNPTGAVPEPSTLLLLGCGIVGLAVVGRNRNSKR